MKIIEPSAELVMDFDGAAVMRHIEKCGRVCYRSQATDDSADNFIRMLIKRGHESVLEHFSCTFKIVCDRGVMAELTRHRLASFSIESTRYCKYDDMQFIHPEPEDKYLGTFLDYDCREVWERVEIYYSYLTGRNGYSPEQARAILPLSLATTIMMTANLREWRHILKLRTDKAAHPQMRQVANMILSVLKQKLPIVFENIGGEKNA